MHANLGCLALLPTCVISIEIEIYCHFRAPRVALGFTVDSKYHRS